MRQSTYFNLLLSSAALTAASPVSLVERNTLLNTFIADLLEYMPALDISINAATSVVTDFDILLGDLIGATTTENQLQPGGPCAEYTLVFARGTSEPGNMGVLVGPPLVWALQDIVGTNGLTIQGVNNYAASVQGYVEGGDPNGAANMASLIQEAYSACPNTKLIASGYSQGCQVTHLALGQLDAATASWVHKVLLFGDPDDGQSIPNVNPANVYTVCHEGDDICQDGDLILVPHLTYAENVAAAAAYATS